MFNNLRELITSMPDEKACRDYLIEQRWHGKPICPYCFCDKVYVIENGRRFKCGHKECYSKFSVTVGTIFKASNIALTKWLALSIYVLHIRRVLVVISLEKILVLVKRLLGLCCTESEK
jgi:hypothetical protein